jgi:O-antigen/teichoic acid export membrane protein
LLGAVSKNKKGFLSLLTGNIISKIILTIGGFYLAFEYGSENFGIYSIFLSYISIISVIAGFRLESIIVITKDNNHDVRNLYLLSLIVTFISTIIITILFISFQIVSKIILLKSLIMFPLIGIGSIFYGWNIIQNNYLSKLDQFYNLSLGMIISSLITILTQYFLLKQNYLTYGLIYGNVIGLLSIFIFFIIRDKNILSTWDPNSALKNIKTNLRTIKLEYSSSIINTVANNILPILILFYFGIIETGIVGLSIKLLVTPLILFSTSFSSIFFKESVLLVQSDKKKLFKTTRKVVMLNFIIMLIYLISINTIGVFILKTFFSYDWNKLELYLIILSLWVLARSTINPIATIFMVIKRNHYLLSFNIYLLITTISSMYIGYVNNDLIISLTLFSILTSIGYITLLLIILNILSRYE